MQNKFNKGQFMDLTLRAKQFNDLGPGDITMAPC